MAISAFDEKAVIPDDGMVSANEIKVMAYVQDRKLVDIGTIHGQQPELLQTMVHITNEK
jgi:hypothetical protein